MVREKLKAGGESKAARLKGKSRTCYNIVIIGWGQGSASFLCIRSWGLLGDTGRGGGGLLDSYRLTVEEKGLELLQGRKRVYPGGWKEKQGGVAQDFQRW